MFTVLLKQKLLSSNPRHFKRGGHSMKQLLCGERIYCSFCTSQLLCECEILKQLHPCDLCILENKPSFFSDVHTWYMISYIFVKGKSYQCTSIHCVKWHIMR